MAGPRARQLPPRPVGAGDVAGPVLPYTDPISMEIIVPGDLPTGPAVLEIEVVDNVERSKGRLIRVQVPVYWRVGP